MVHPRIHGGELDQFRGGERPGGTGECGGGRRAGGSGESAAGFSDSRFYLNAGVQRVVYGVALNWMGGVDEFAAAHDLKGVFAVYTLAASDYLTVLHYGVWDVYSVCATLLAIILVFFYVRASRLRILRYLLTKLWMMTV